jgi:phenylpropionate dioxygenase-like ring-hydroxylating dioxygenase large terminal subunit
MGIPLVIWHQPAASGRSHRSSSSSSNGGGSWRVFADVCPHRLVPLSEGRITPAGLLECPYHGWAFNGQGGCEVIPQVTAVGKQGALAGSNDVRKWQ